MRRPAAGLGGEADDRTAVEVDGVGRREVVGEDDHVVLDLGEVVMRDPLQVDAARARRRPSRRRRARAGSRPITTHFASKVLPASVRKRKRGSPIFSKVVTISPR